MSQLARLSFPQVTNRLVRKVTGPRMNHGPSSTATLKRHPRGATGAD